MLRLSFPTLSDHRGSDPALLPLGNQCLDWSDRHRRVSSCAVLRGHQAVPNTKEHSGEYLLGSSSRENDHFRGQELSQRLLDGLPDIYGSQRMNPSDYDEGDICGAVKFL